MNVGTALLWACAAIIGAEIAVFVFLAALAGARRKTEATSVDIARRMLATSIVILPFVAVFALGWGFATGWA